MFPNVGMGELVVILLIVLLLFGAKRLPDVAKAIGRSIRSLKEGMSDTGDSSGKPPENGSDKK